MTSREWSSLDEDIKLAMGAFQEVAPVKLSAIAKVLNLRVLSTVLPVGISGEIRPDTERPGNFVIRVNKADSSRRQRFTVAHEIAHFLLHRDHIGGGIRDDALYRSDLSDWREAQANRLAADLLMPDHLVTSWLRHSEVLRVDDTVAFLADKFNVSEAAMKIKLGID